MKTPVLTITKPFDGNLYFYPANLSLTEGKYLFMVVSARKNIDDEVIKFYTSWLAKAVSIYKFENSNNLKLLQILSDLMEETGSSYFFWEHEITGCVIVRKHSKKCTFYILRFGCSFAAVNTIKPQLL